MIFSLNLVGHKRYGRRAVEHLSKYNVSSPEKYDRMKESLIIQLHQCLTEIASRIKQKQEHALRVYCAKHLLNGVNPNGPATKSILSLFGSLVKEKKITGDDQIEFAQALACARIYDCFKYLINYRKRNGLPTAAYQVLIDPGMYY